MDELCSNILYQTLHFSGCDADADRPALWEYLLEVFNLDKVIHKSLIEGAKWRAAPKTLLNVEVIQANILKSKGLSNPFCTLYLTSSSTNQHSTTVKSETLNPIWNMEFQMPTDSSTDDVLCVEVWNFKSDQSKKKKGLKGIKSALKDVTSPTSQSRQDKLMGSVYIPLKDIPAAGQVLSYAFNKKNKIKKKGEIKLCLTFHYEKNKQAAFQEHRYLIENVVLHELKSLKVEPQSWNGSLSSSGEKILVQHRVQCKISKLTETLAQWVEFSNIHSKHPLSFSIFLSLLQKLVTSIEDNLLTDEEKLLFWNATVTLLPSCLSGVKSIQVLTSSNKTINESTVILILLSQLAELSPPNGIDLFPAALHDRLTRRENQTYSDIRTAVVQTASQGAEEWLSNLIEKHGVNESTEEEEKITGLLQVVNAALESLKKAIDYHDAIFQQYFHFTYAATLYKLADAKFSELIEPVVTSVWKTMKPLKFNDNTAEGIYDVDPLSLNSLLFELYICLQNLASLAQTVCLPDLLPNKFHLWFQAGVIHWLFTSQYKAMHAVQRAVTLDNLVPMYNETKYSSSACDILHIVNQIKIFWRKLEWPNTEELKEFGNKIINDICECIMFFAEKMCHKVEEICNCESQNDKMTEVCCIAVTNMDYIQKSLFPIIDELGVNTVSAPHNKDVTEALAYDSEQTVRDVINTTIEAARDKLHNAAAQKIMATIGNIVTEVFDNIDSEERLHKLMSTLDVVLYSLQSYLSRSNFNSILNIIWKDLYRRISNILEINVKTEREQYFFKRSNEILGNLVEFFKRLDGNIDMSNVSDLQQVIHLNAMDTWELIHQYRLDQLSEQKAIETPKHGVLAVRMMFIEDMLKVEILNARNLQPISPKGCCYPYVKIYLLPENKFKGVRQPKTKTHKNTVFPLFDESFMIQLKPSYQRIENAMVMLMVKEKSYLRKNRYLGETLISFDDIPRFDGSIKFYDLEQMHLKLNPPTRLDSGAFVILEHYHERMAREFIKNRQLRKHKNKAASKYSTQAMSDVWNSIQNIIGYVGKGPLPVNFSLFIPSITFHSRKSGNRSRK
ncbi:protein unc-13 homolog 4B-like [Periplaneta americana]|uniref:protein unc-13 homolog 4B-like n=1 Tax=Periplaneta americana TaxID=6978 RepID=UPI0037E793D5